MGLIAGGPPCQGFSLAGKRKADDHRNHLFEKYIEFVSLIEPALLLVENVRGIKIEFGKKHKQQNGDLGDESEAKAVSEVFKERLREQYVVWDKVLDAWEFGIPQTRSRYFIIGIRKDLLEGPQPQNPFRFLGQQKTRLRQMGVLDTTVEDAISDLEITHHPGGKDCLPRCKDRERHRQIPRLGPPPRSAYWQLLHGRLNGHLPNSLGLANHSPATEAKFAAMQDECRPGTQLSGTELERVCRKLNLEQPIRKRARTVLKKDGLAPTIVTLPDDILHYKEPRILTVRECARLQSFPDWFDFKGKYTTGGHLRRKECPRYTQVGNAVPPLLAESLGRVLLGTARWLERKHRPGG